MTANLRRLLEPDSIAIIGASIDESKRGNRTLRNLQEAGYDGDLYAVNSKYDGRVHGVSFYSSVSEIPADIDLAFLATPARIVPTVLRDCVEADVAGAVSIAAGFSEVGNSDLETEIRSILDSSDLRLIGPNVQGFINTHTGVDLIGGYDIPHGRVGLLTQSGNVGIDLAEQARKRQSVGFSYNIGLGNELDVKCHEYLPILADDTHTEVIAAYVEGLAAGREFLQTVKEVNSEVPVVVFKGGKSQVGRNSVSSHTASLAGEHAALRGAYRQAGAITVDRFDAILPTAEALANLPIADSPRVGVLSDGGGHATIAADALSAQNLTLPELAPATADRIRSTVETAPNVRNPVDIMGQGGNLLNFSRCAEHLMRDSNIDALLLTGAFGGYSTYEYLEDGKELDAARELVALVDKHDVPLVVHSYYDESATLQYLRNSRITVCQSVETACAVLSALATRHRAVATVDQTSDFALESQPGELLDDTDTSMTYRTYNRETRQLSEHESKQLLDAYEIPFVPSPLTTSPKEATDAAASFGKTVAMKVSSPEIVHSTDADCVALEVVPADAAAEFDRLVENARSFDPDASINGVIVSPMVDGDIELFVGAMADAEVGPVIAFGIGGVFVEILNDISFRAVPLTDHDARELLDAIEGRPLLDGVRGGTQVDEDMLVTFLRSVSELVANERIAELDLNPVVVSDNRILALDASIKLYSGGPVRTRNGRPH